MKTVILIVVAMQVPSMEGLNWASKDVLIQANDINEDYFDGEFDLTDTEAKDYAKNFALFREEMVAYITGRMHNGEDVSGMINNAAEAKAMWEAFVAKQTGDKSVKFSLKKPVEQTKTLVALHNLTAEKLLKSLKLGGSEKNNPWK